jgi:hypothetical protein
MSFVWADNVKTSLAAPITTTSQTTITLASAAGLPTLSAGQVFVVTLNDVATGNVFEICHATAISGANLTVIRGQEGTAAQTWLVGDKVFGALTAAQLATFSAGPPAGASFLDTSSTPQAKVGPITASQFNGPLNGNASTATSATTATTAGSAAALSVPYVASVANSDGSITIVDSGPTDGATATVSVTPGHSVFPSAGTSSGRGPTNATITLPNDGRAYTIVVDWSAYCVGDSLAIGSPTGGGTSGFETVAGSGFNSGTLRTLAYCIVAAAAGQTLTFALTGSGGTSTAAGIWLITAYH